MSASHRFALIPVFLLLAGPGHTRQAQQARPASPAPVSPVMKLMAQGSKLYLAQNYRQAIGPYQQALDLEKKNATLTPTMFRVLVDNLGISYGITGDLKHARETFEFGVGKDPAYPLFHYNLACAHAEMDDLDGTLAELALAYKFKQNIVAGEEFPEPRTDDSFQRYLKNPRFLAFLKSTAPSAALVPAAPSAIRGTLLHGGGLPIAGAQVVLQVFADKACARLFDTTNPSSEDSAKVAKCSRDLFSVESNEKGEFIFSGVQPGWYAVRFLFNIEPKPSKGPSADHLDGFLVIYAAQKDVSGRFDTLAQGPAFEFTATQDYRVDFRY